MKKEKIPHQVLNAKFHEKEAQIIAEAGRPGAVTIATNMAGRGTDIVLGGNLDAELKALENPSPEEISQRKAAWQERHDRCYCSGWSYMCWELSGMNHGVLIINYVDALVVKVIRVNHVFIFPCKIICCEFLVANV